MVMNSSAMGGRPYAKPGVSFGAAKVNVLAMSDNHGMIKTLPELYDVVSINSKKIFPSKKPKSTLNVFAIVGDYFINPKKRGLKSTYSDTVGDMQSYFLSVLNRSVKKLVPKKSQYHAIYTPGNHCFDGGDDWLSMSLRDKRVETVLTNVDFKSSKLIHDLVPERRGRVHEAKILEVQDDKNPKLKHKVLSLGTVIPGVDFYTPGLVNNLKVFDRTNKKDIHIQEDDLKETYQVLNSKIKSFKKENPNGAVMLNSHMGSRLSEFVAKNVDGIDLILNGHDHLDKEFNVGKTKIVCLGENNNFVASAKLKFDDSGKLNGIGVKKYYAKDLREKPSNHISQLFKNLLDGDEKPLLKINDPANKISTLPKDGIRYENSTLANVVSDSILEAIRGEKPDVQAFGIPSSSFRQGVSMGSTNMDLLNLLNGSIEKLSEVETGKVKGQNFLGAIAENVQANFKAPSRNTIIQWAGVKINKPMLKPILTDDFDLKKTENIKTLLHKAPNAIMVKGFDGKYSPIDLNKSYKIALPLKYLAKDDIHYPAKLRASMSSTGKSMDNYLRQSLEKNDYVIDINDSALEQRIVS